VTETPATETPIIDTPGGTPTESAARLQAIDAQQATGSIVVTAQDSGGGAVDNACFVVFEDNNGSQGQFVAQGCDSDDGSDGVTTIAGVPAGTYLLVSSFVPEGVVLGGQRQVTVVAGQSVTETFVFATGGRTIVIEKVDENGDPLPGSCFNVNKDVGNGQPGDFVSGNCSDPNRTDGLVFVNGIAPGSYVLVETQAPDGYVAGTSLAFTVTAGTEDVPLPVRNSPIESGGNLIVNKVDENSAPLGGACFDAFVDEGGGNPGDFVAGRCDFSDGQNDGQTVIAGIAAGNYVLIESVAPAGYIVGGSWAFSISADAPTVRTIANVPGGATLTVYKVDENGDPLTDSCFVVRKLLEGGDRQDYVTNSCDNNGSGTNDGTVVIEGLAPGNYVLFEDVVPDGYVRGADTPFTVNQAADDLSLTVENVPRGGGGGEVPVDPDDDDGDGDGGDPGEGPGEPQSPDTSGYPDDERDDPVTPGEDGGTGGSGTVDTGLVSGLPNTGSGETYQWNPGILLAGIASLTALMAACVWRRRLT